MGALRYAMARRRVQAQEGYDRRRQETRECRPPLYEASASDAPPNTGAPGHAVAHVPSVPAMRDALIAAINYFLALGLSGQCDKHVATLLSIFCVFL